ncbi:MAG TPA: TonB-dependent receptor [Thiolapillus brandeum]|uniref:TonB-dependent receptor n=1 Tax=Thiolapillus brandeum TaxID=1076588 RepID=A0A831NYR8_9GAMM|nr:TonB-dependent receptor [Thiolapillus brandeum]
MSAAVMGNHPLLSLSGLLLLLSMIEGSALAEEISQEEESEKQVLDVISVTASRIERATKETPGAIDVIDEKRIDASTMFNIKDAIRGIPGVLIDSKNGGYDVRLIIRGAGQKANYGVREIMVLRDGVPMTDPDSFSRFDYIDTQDIERIEITKGPGSLYSSGAAGGTIQIISKSVFDLDSNRLKLGVGNHGSRMLHGRYAGNINEENAFSLTFSHRETDNSWRKWNEYQSDQLSFKHGLMLSDGSTLESELSYSKADIQLPASMTEAEFEEFKDSGEQKETSDPWQHKGRYSTIWFFNSRLEKEIGAITFKPRVYYNHWDHYHPVTGAINDTPGTDSFGTDLEFSYDHQFLGDSTLVAGITARKDESDDSRKYQYQDVVYTPWDRIDYTLSDKKGDLLKVQDAANTLYGIFMQETIRPTERLSADIGFRFDKSRFNIDTTEYGEYSWSKGKYIDFSTPVITNTNKAFDLFSPRLGISYAVTDLINAYFIAAQSDQVPSEGEIRENPDLDSASARNIEIGLKGRAYNWSFDLDVYYTTVTDEIVSILNGYQTEFENAGKTKKKGLEFSSRLNLNDYFTLGANYAYSDYSFGEFYEPIYGVGNVDRSGNQIPYIPRHQYSLTVDFSHPSGFKARIQSDTWGEYYMDNANTEKYEGYEFLTSLMLGYEKGPHAVSLNVDNLFDQHYAAEVKKNTTGRKTYYAGAPRSAMLTYRYSF